MKALVIGATGYVGLRIARTLQMRGIDVHGLARNASAKDKLCAAEIASVDGDLSAIDTLAQHLDDYDTLVFAATVSFEDEQHIIRTLLGAFSRPGRSLIFISGSGVVSTPARDGSWNDYTAAEDDPYPFAAMRNRRVRLVTEQLIVNAADDGLRTFVIRPPLIWGHAGSIQVPQFFESARKLGAVCYLGQGLNLYSHVHVDDVAAAAPLALEKGSPGRIYHVVAGEVNFRTIAEAVGEVTGCPTCSLTYEQAVELWGAAWVDVGLAVNSRIRAPRTRAELGWHPQHVDLVDDIRYGSYKQAYDARKERDDTVGYSWRGHG
jgi:nucleoside-diphosphate-sugar epimerase